MKHRFPKDLKARMTTIAIYDMLLHEYSSVSESVGSLRLMPKALSWVCGPENDWGSLRRQVISSYETD